MKDILSKFVDILKADATLATLMGTTTPNNYVFVGPVDIVVEEQSDLQIPQINMHVISEFFNTVPQDTRETRVQIDVWSRKNEVQVADMYERIAELLNYQISDKNSTHIFWQRVGGMTEQYESDVRIWHYSVDFMVWSQ